jgi:signal transduction histidine kinase
MFCHSNNPIFLIFSENVPSLVYYSHIPIFIITLYIGIYFYFKNRNKLINIVFFVITLFFSIWVILDLIFWASNKSDVIMFIWSTQILIEPMIHIASLYLLYLLLYKKDVPLKFKIITFLFYIPIVILAPTKLTLTSFDVEKCLSQESFFSYYTYLIEIISIFSCLFIFYKKHKEKINRIDIKKDILLLTNVVMMLSLFTWGAITGSLTENWDIAQFGLFGMPVFLSLLIYYSIEFDVSELKMLGKNFLVISMWVLIASLLINKDLNINTTAVLITFIISIIFGLVIIRLHNKESVQMGIISSLAHNLNILNSSLTQKVEEQTLTIQASYDLEMKAHRELKKLSDTKDQFVSLAQHNLRVPISSIANNLKDILTGKYGVIDSKTAAAIEDTVQASDSLRHIADDLKDIAKMKIGSQILDTKSTNLLPILKEVIQDLKLDIKNMEITLSYPTDDSYWPEVKVDQNKIRDVFIVIIENAIKYNKKGGTIDIITTKKEDGLEIKIANTGIGITKDEHDNILSKSFYRSQRVKETNPTGMGIGLFLSKLIIEAHHGSLNINSNGLNRGAEVTILLQNDFLNNLDI